MLWTIEYVRDGLALSTDIEAPSLNKAWPIAFELEEDPTVEILDVYMADRQGKTENKAEFCY